MAENSSDTSTSRLLAEPAKYGLVTLDPSLEDVQIEYSASELVGAVVLAAPLDQVARQVRKVSLAVKDGDSIQLADEEGLASELSSSSDREKSSQYHIHYSEGKWNIKGLERKEKDYPVFGTS